MTDACFGMSVRTFPDAERAGVGAFPDAERAGLSECPLGGAAIYYENRDIFPSIIDNNIK